MFRTTEIEKVLVNLDHAVTASTCLQTSVSVAMWLVFGRGICENVKLKMVYDAEDFDSSIGDPLDYSMVFDVTISVYGLRIRNEVQEVWISGNPLVITVALIMKELKVYDRVICFSERAMRRYQSPWDIDDDIFGFVLRRFVTEGSRNIIPSDEETDGIDAINALNIVIDILSEFREAADGNLSLTYSEIIGRVIYSVTSRRSWDLTELGSLERIEYLDLPHRKVVGVTGSKNLAESDNFANFQLVTNSGKPYCYLYYNHVAGTSDMFLDLFKEIGNIESVEIGCLKITADKEAVIDQLKKIVKDRG